MKLVPLVLLVAALSAHAKSKTDPNAILENGKPLALAGGGKVVFKRNEQVLGKECSAKREWLEVEGLKNAEAETAINEAIRKEMTVGMKLTKKRCGEYHNKATVTGSRRKWLGVQTNVFFGGGSGRSVIQCAIYNLETGKRETLESYLTYEGKEKLAKELCHDPPKGECPGYDEAANQSVNFRYCLLDDGVRLFDPAGNHWEGKIDLPEKDLKQYFELPKDFELKR